MSDRQLTDAQGEAVAFEGSEAIVAAAGSGKTTVLVEKIARLVESDRLPLDRLLVVTFTEKTGAELQERIATRLKRAPDALKTAAIGTIHAFASSLLRLHGEPLGVNPTFSVMEEFLTNLERLRSTRDGLLTLAESGNSEALEAIRRFGFHRAVRFFVEVTPLVPRRDLGNFPYSALAGILRGLYDQEKRRRNLVDFNDLEEGAVAILSEEKPRRLYREKFRWIIVDEFQDVSPIQWRILSSLYAPGKNRLVIVGDPRQSIYRFRGADPSLFHRVSRAIEKEGGKIFYLNENFRSSAPVIDFVNRASSPLFEDRFPPMLGTRPQPGGVERIPLGGEGLQREKREEERRVTVDRLLALHRDGYRWNEIALLFKTRRAIPLFEEAFRNGGIPYASDSGELLLERPEVLSLLFFLKRALSPGSSDHELVETAIKASPLAPCAPFTPKEGETVDEDFLDELFRLVTPCFPAEAEKRNLGSFKKLLQQLLLYSGKTGPEAGTVLLATLQALRDEEARISCPPPEETGDVVRLMTVHAAKGLEFPVVVLCDLAGRPAHPQRLYLIGEDGVVLRDRDAEAQGLKEGLSKSERFEALEGREKEADLEESKRLLYVALTRARERLILPLPPARDGTKGGQLWSDWLIPYVDT